MKCLSVQQPWADLIARGHKDIENRTWETSVRGWVLLHAGKKVDTEALAHLVRAGRVTGVDPLPLGCLVGAMRIDGCVTESPSDWFGGPYGFQIGAAVRFNRPLPLRGMLGFFNVPAGWAELEEQLPAHVKEGLA